MTLLRNLLLTLLWPVGYVLSKMGSQDRLGSYEDYIEISKIIQAGDCLVSREKRKYTNAIIPGYWGHVAICTGDLVIEAVPPRVRRKHLAEFVMGADDIAVLRPKFSTVFRDRSNEYLGLKYNLGLFWAKSWVCSMLVLSWYRKDSIGKFPVRIRKTLGIETGAPQDIFDDRENFELIYMKDEE